MSGPVGSPVTVKSRSRHIPAAVRAVVWERDGAQCAFVSHAGHRCTERTFLEFHHLLPYAREGPGTADNIALRCRRHNQHEGELDFGPSAGH
jgi:5-methylcytosine-specific restriction endonuclease McrA